jgi:hypothetical protein
MLEKHIVILEKVIDHEAGKFKMRIGGFADWLFFFLWRR